MLPELLVSLRFATSVNSKTHTPPVLCTMVSVATGLPLQRKIVVSCCYTTISDRASCYRCMRCYVTRIWSEGNQ